MTTRTFRCMAFSGRHVLAGFASGIEAEDEGMVPRPVLFGNFSLVGRVPRLRRRPARGQGRRRLQLPVATDTLALHEQILGLVASGAVRPLVGLDVPFDELPAALDAMEQRRTVGRIVVRL